MRRALGAAALGVALCGVATAAPTPEIARDFEAANERTLEGDHAGAVGLYRSLLERGVVNEDVYHNLGNAYAHLGRPVDAIVAYRRALSLDPDDPSARANLEAVEAQLLGEREAPEALGFTGAVAPVVRPLPRRPFAWALVILNAVLFAALYLRRRAEGRARGALTGAAVFALVTGLLAAGVTASHYAVASEATAVLTEGGALREGPDTRFEEAGPAEAGLTVRVLGRDAGWLLVQRPDGTTGWLPADRAAEIRGPVRASR